MTADTLLEVRRYRAAVAAREVIWRVSVLAELRCERLTTLQMAWRCGIDRGTGFYLFKLAVQKLRIDGLIVCVGHRASPRKQNAPSHLWGLQIDNACRLDAGRSRAA